MNDKNDERWLRWSLASIAVLLAVIAIELSTLLGPLQPQVQAQIPDSGLQRKQMLDLQEQTNVLLGQILQHLRQQPIKVVIVGGEKETAPAGKPVLPPAKPVLPPEKKSSR